MLVSLLVHETAEDFARRQDPAAAGGYWGAYTAYGQALAAAGVMRGGAGLLPPATAVAVRQRPGQPMQVLDGPYSETREMLGGYYVLEVPDIETAKAWAAQCPGAESGTIEIRAHIPMPG
jgi:hypothetical protein